MLGPTVVVLIILMRVRAAVSSSIDILFVMDTLFYGMSCRFTIEFGKPLSPKYG